MVRNGIKNGLQILLDAETYDYGSSPNGGEGFILSILHHLDIPIMKNSGININTGQSNNLVVTATLMNTSEAVRNRFFPQQRNCYFEDEIQLLHLPQENSFRYDISNCLFEATLQKIEENCHCVPAYFQDTVPEVPVCTGSSINCMKQLKEEMGSIKHITDGGKHGTVLDFSGPLWPLCTFSDLFEPLVVEWEIFGSICTSFHLLAPPGTSWHLWAPLSISSTC